MQHINVKRACAVILAAGIGSRMNSELTKQRMEVLGRSVIDRTVEAFYKSDKISDIVVVGREEEMDFLKTELERYTDKIFAIVTGGKTRAESAMRGFSAIPDNTDLVAIHDGARCLISESDIARVVDAAITSGAAILCSPIHDTVKLVLDGFVEKTVDRAQLLRAETPQVFAVDIYRRALLSGLDASLTDDCSLVEKTGVKVATVVSSSINLKITTREDLLLAEYVQRERERLCAD